MAPHEIGRGKPPTFSMLFSFPSASYNKQTANNPNNTLVCHSHIKFTYAYTHTPPGLSLEKVKPVDPEYARKKAEEEEEQRRAAARAAGTPVTPENFKAWRTHFDAEMALEKAKLIDQKAAEEKAKKLTGRQWFEGRHKGAEGEEGPLADAHAGEELLEEGDLEADDDFDFEDDDEDGEEVFRCCWKF